MPKPLGKPGTIHKTVRLTQAQIDLIESQGQGSFTANLDYLLTELLLGESDRVRRLQDQQSDLFYLRDEIVRLRQYIWACRRYCTGLEEALDKALDLDKLLEKDSAISLNHISLCSADMCSGQLRTDSPIAPSPPVTG